MASSSSLVNYPVGRVRYRIDIPKRVVVTNFVRREWEASVDERECYYSARLGTCVLEMNLLWELHVRMILKLCMFCCCSL